MIIIIIECKKCMPDYFNDIIFKSLGQMENYGFNNDLPCFFNRMQFYSKDIIVNFTILKIILVCKKGYAQFQIKSVIKFQSMQSIFQYL